MKIVDAPEPPPALGDGVALTSLVIIAPEGMPLRRGRRHYSAVTLENALHENIVEDFPCEIGVDRCAVEGCFIPCLELFPMNPAAPEGTPPRRNQCL